MRGLIPELERARQAALQALEWLGRLNYPDYECDYEFVAVDAGAEYPFIGKRVISNRGLDISVRDYDGHFEERQVPHSNALHSRLKERGAYLCGPLAHRPAPPGRRRRRAGRLARIIGIGQQWAGDDGVGLAVMAPKKH
jgi:hypothetical protein